MVGDSADNIPGIKGIGVKGAAQLLGEYDNLKEILAQRDSFSPRRKQACEDFIGEREQLIRDLVAVRRDVALNDSAGPFTLRQLANLRPFPSQQYARATLPGESPVRASASAYPGRYRNRLFSLKMRLNCAGPVSSNWTIHLPKLWALAGNYVMKCKYNVHFHLALMMH